MGKKYQSLPCIVCGKQLVNVLGEGNQPEDGLACTTPGHYGSTVFDPIDGNYLEFNVCDLCMVRAGDQGRVLTARQQRPVIVEGCGIVGWENVEPNLKRWDVYAKLPKDYRLIEVEDLDDLPKGIHLTPGLTPDMIRNLANEYMEMQ